MNRFYFLQKPSAWSSNFYLRVQSKVCGRKFFLILPFWSFPDSERKIFQTFGQKNVKNFSKLTSTCPEEQSVAWIFSAWFSKFYLRVQSKNFRRNSFPISLFRFFSDFDRKIFQTFGQKTWRFCRNYLLRVQRNILWLEFFFRFWIVSDFLQKPLAWFSSFYLRVQSKTCGRKSILIFLFRNFFGFWAKNFSDFWPKSSRSCQNYLLRVQINNLRLKIFLKFWSVLHFLQKPSAWSSNFYLRVQSKVCGRNIFFNSSFLNFSGFWAKNFSDFWPKSVKNFSKLSSTCPEEQFVAWNSSAWFSKFYLRVQSKNFRRNSFLIFLFRFFSDFEQNFFQTFGEKSSKNCQNYLLRVQRNILWLELFLSFESFPIFCRNHWHGSQKSIYVSRVKIAEEIIFLILLFRVFLGFWEKHFSDFWPKNF